MSAARVSVRRLESGKSVSVSFQETRVRVGPDLRPCIPGDGVTVFFARPMAPRGSIRSNLGVRGRGGGEVSAPDAPANNIDRQPIAGLPRPIPGNAGTTRHRGPCRRSGRYSCGSDPTGSTHRGPKRLMTALRSAELAVFSGTEPTPENTAFVRFRKALVITGLDRAVYAAVTVTPGINNDGPAGPEGPPAAGCGGRLRGISRG